MAKVVVSFSEKGEVKVEVEGVTGKACELLTKDLERKLGKVTSKKRKPEYYEREKKNEVKGSY